MGCTQSARSYSLPSLDAPYIVSNEVVYGTNSDDEPTVEVLGEGSKSQDNDSMVMCFDDIIQLALSGADFTGGARVIGKSIQFPTEDGAAVVITESMQELEPDKGFAETFMANLRRNEYQRQYSLHSLWDLGHFDKKAKKHLERSIALCLYREETYAGFERYFRIQSGVRPNNESPAQAMLPKNLNVYCITVKEGNEIKDTTYTVTTAAAFSDSYNCKDDNGLVSLLADKRLLEDPLENLKRAYDPLDAIRAKCSSVLDLLDLIRHHIRRAIGEQNEFILYETVQDLVMTNYEMEIMCQDTAPSDEEETIESFEPTSSALESQMVGAFSHLYLRLNFFLRDDIDSLSEIKASLTSLEYSVHKMLARARPYVSQLQTTECSSLGSLTNKIQLRRDKVLCQLISALVSTITFTLKNGIDDVTFLKQIKEFGLFVCLQSLLDHKGTERCMLEDMVVAAQDLSSVKIQLNLTPNSKIQVEGSKYDYVVSIPLPVKTVDKLPEDLNKLWGGERQLISVHPVFFNAGMESSAENTLTGVNRVGLARCKEYAQLFDCNNDDNLQENLRKLEIEIADGINRNGRILLLASELCQRMRGLTIVTCASGLDRTSMATAHNFTRILAMDHGLRLEDAPEVTDRLVGGNTWNQVAARLGRSWPYQKKSVVQSHHIERS